MSDTREALDWLAGVLQGDFHEDPSTSQIIVGGIVSAIPIVGEVVDIRDIVANICKLCKKPDDPWGWLFLVVSILALIPVVGGVLKGVLGLLVRAMRKGEAPSDKTLEAMLAIVRGAGKGDPVRFLRTLPWDRYSQEVLRHFKEIMQAIQHGLRNVHQNWLVRRMASEDTMARLKLVDTEVGRLMARGEIEIPKAMRVLRQEVDKLLSRARPEVAKGQAGAQTVIKHSERPLQRVQYEARDRLMREQVDQMRRAGKSEKEIAEYAMQGRQQLQREAREKMDPELRKVIVDSRNTKASNHPDGPQFTYNKTTDQWDYQKRVFDEESGASKTIIHSKSHQEVTESALKTGGDDIPWDKTLEYTRAKHAGQEAKAKRILEDIKKAMQQKDRN